MWFDGLTIHEGTCVMETCSVLIFVVLENYVKSYTQALFCTPASFRGWQALSCLLNRLATHRKSMGRSSKKIKRKHLHFMGWRFISECAGEEDGPPRTLAVAAMTASRT